MYILHGQSVHPTIIYMGMNMDMTNPSRMLRLRYERQRRGWRQDDLAYHSRVPTAEISRIESGRLRPTEAQLARLGKALGVDPSVLLQEV